MRMKLFVVVAILALVAGMSVVNAQDLGITERGLGVVISWGTSTKTWESRVVLKGERTGADLIPMNGVVQPERDEAIVGQILFATDGDVRPGDFRFSFSTLATPEERDWTEADFNPRLGWVFRIPSEEYVNSRLFDTPLQFRVWIRNGKMDYVRVIFKFSFGRDAVSRNVLFIRPTDPAPMADASVSAPVVADPSAIDRNLEQIQSALSVLGESQQVLADRLNDTTGRVDQLEARTTRVEEAWEAQATETPALSTPSQTTREILGQRYAGKSGFVFYSTTPVVKAWWFLSSRGWTRCDNNLSVTPSDEKYWLYDASEQARLGRIGFGLGEGDAEPVNWYPLDAVLTVMEVN